MTQPIETNELKTQFSGLGSQNTPEGAIIRAGSKHLSKTITLSANNTSASVNVFQITGVVQITGIHAEIMDATTLTNCTDIYFDLWDGTASSPISKTTTAAISGFNVGAFIIKDSALATALATLNNDQARVAEAAAGNKSFFPFLAIQKTATNTYIRFRYTTTDAPINAQIECHIHWTDIDSGTAVAV